MGRAGQLIRKSRIGLFLVAPPSTQRFQEGPVIRGLWVYRLLGRASFREGELFRATRGAGRAQVAEADGELSFLFLMEIYGAGWEEVGM